MKRHDPNQLRRVRFTPYLPGKGPVFWLTTWQTGKRDSRGSDRIRYRLNMVECGRATTLFAGDDFSLGAGGCSDSDFSLGELMAFLTLRPGDVDPHYFKDYTPAQLDYCKRHAEALSCCVVNRFDPENKGSRQ